MRDDRDSDVVRTSVHSRTFGEELARVREHAHFRGRELGEVLDWSPSRVSHVEHGSRGTSEADLAYYLGMCGADPHTTARIMDLHKQIDNEYLIHNHEPGLPDELRTLIRHEAQATQITYYQSMILPGILQTPDYARSIISTAVGVPRDGIESRLRARMERQSILHLREAPGWVFYLHEAALRTMVDSGATMEDQMMHLVLMSNWRKISIRVIPRSAPGATWLRGQFMIMDYARYRSVVYVEQEISSLFLDEPTPVATYRLMAERLAEVALDEEESRSMLADLASEYYEPRGTDAPAGDPELA
ncbi:helix-turn-helix transcriptional regulator [Umezawaea sp. Da 62-37]|uniref:helix-turn-helix domain-containing protein n=1 Tax=Umezawaea sp. Da 62-37 TaxID=3075927 RepID=UPI0028F74D92|nr:helix-turn-helix transcriptional regulator [Umezawaea sp. Da 62-37]WNV89807.1 helix-turn-helix transcriptional regulator [Umezawaea sp. Da 62-37]